ncbi:MAG TPA: CRISPR-associated helicase Cas3' [Symbiobacteriaceae bacterium]|jgi:CRISPR-associated endonuclease/helicase Cas3
MVVLILESVPIGLRGELSKWMLEPKASVFVGTISGAVRDLLWDKACEAVRQGGCTMIYRTANEQGFAIRSFGDTTRAIEQWEGLFLVRRPTPKPETTTAPADSPPIPVDWEQLLHLECWAKSPDRVELAPGEGHYHPLICHMIDVSMVALRLWQYVVPPALKERIRAQLGVATMQEAGRWVAFFAGLHDLGKATPSFAQKWADGWKVLVKKGYRPARTDEAKPHYILSTHLLRTLLSHAKLPEKISRPVAQIMGGHHGLFPSAQDLRFAERFAGEQPWTAAQANLVRLLAHTLGLDQAPTPMGDLTQENGLLMILSGLTSVADWIASDHRLFPFAGDDVHLPRYPRRARWLAWKALHRLGWFHRPHGSATLSFQELFDKVPNRLQEQVMAIAPELKGPSLVLLEYPMGGGKTEGALYIADYLAATAGHSGAYFALPTMATSNQMFGRVNTYLANRFPDSTVNVQLLHGHASLNAEFEVLKRAGADLVLPAHISGGKESGLLAAEWFTFRKRGLLAPYGIGTIDQVLLAVLQTKHFFVRLFGLAGKVVILDEVHAYDTYMQALLSRLLTWLAACGTSVILLSATLPVRTRQGLLAAYAAGRGQTSPPDGPTVAYPRITWVTEGGTDARHISGAAERTVAVRLCSQTEHTWITELKDALAGGGCAAVILNTVTRAQAIYGELKEHFPTEELMLFHARYPFDDRMARELSVLERFGPEAPDRPHRAVVVATQVIEQSLDLDFDLMVTDLAPVDLLLQRSGRVWRHPRPWRPPGLTLPPLWVLMPPTDEVGRPIFEKGSARIYEIHTLLRTWLVLDGRERLVIPQDVEGVVEAVYREEPALPNLPEPLRVLWAESWEKLEEAERKDAGKAQKRYIPGVTGDMFLMGMEALDEEDETLHQAHQAITRLGGPSASVICLLAEEGKLWAVGPERREIRLEKQPDAMDIRALLGRSVRISFAPGLVRRILAEETPPTWQASAYLRRYRLLRFGPDGACLTADLPLRLDPVLGLQLVSVREEEDS